MNKLMTPTLALVIAGGLAAGIALARPGNAPAQVPGAPAPAPAATAPASGYGANSAVQPPAAAQPPAAVEPASILIRDFAFSGPTTVAAGQQVVVTNQDSAAHTLTFDSGDVDTGTIAGGGSAAVIAPNAPGTYSFFCAIHPSMQGQLVVQG